MSISSFALTLALSQSFPSQTHRFVDLPSGRTHYEDVGTGDVVLLIHGVSGPLQVWDKTESALVEAGFRVIRFDLYGRGMSTRLEDSSYDLPIYVRQVEELLASLNIERPIRIAGSSFGAVIATEYALLHPDQTTSVTLVGPAGFEIKTPPLAKLRDVPILGDLMRPLFGKSIIKKQNRKYAYDDALFREFWPYFDAQLDVEGTVEAMLSTMKNSPVTNYIDSYAKLGNLRIPVGVIWGRQDVTFPYSNHEDLLRAIPQANMFTVEHAAHLPQWERPDPTNQALISILRNSRAQ